MWEWEIKIFSKAKIRARYWYDWRDVEAEVTDTLGNGLLEIAMHLFPGYFSFQHSFHTFKHFAEFHS